MATKKKAAKPVPKKAVKKLAAKKPTKKLVAKKLAPKKAVAAKPVKKLASKGKPAVKKLVKPVVKKVIAKPAAAAKPKQSRPIKNPASDYRVMRKYTHLKLAEVAEDVATIRATIGSDGGDAPLAAWELVDYLKAIEGQIPDWKAKKLPLPNGQKRKRGRPSKAEIEARNGQVKQLKGPGEAKASLAKAKSFAAKAKAAAPVVKPLANGVRPVFKLVRPAATAN